MAESSTLKNVSIVVGIIGSLVGIFIAIATYLNSRPETPPDGGSHVESSGVGCGVTVPAEITLSAGHAARGAQVTVYGKCFQPGERVELRVHVTEVGSATADSDGGFTQTITIPDSAPPAGFPTDIVATGRQSIKTGTAAFETG